MKKVLFLFFFILSTVMFGETLTRVTYRNGVYTATFRENRIIESVESYNKTDSQLMLDFENLRLSSSIQKTLTINDQFVDFIQITEVAGTTTISFYLKDNVNYVVSKSRKETKVTFSKSKPSVSEVSVPKKKYTIVVDAGHGGKDPGALGNGYREKDVALSVAKKLRDELSKDFRVIMTRDDDYFVTLKERAEIGNGENADFFVSIHLNAASNPSATGAEVFYYSKNQSAYAAEVAKYENDFDTSSGNIGFSDFIINDIFYRINQQKSAAVATDVLDNLISNFGLRRRGVFGANFAVLRGSNSPSILVELGFITNYNDISLYLSKSSHERAAKAIADAIRKHFD